MVDSISSDEEDFEVAELFDKEPKEVSVERGNVGEQMGCEVFVYTGVDWGVWSTGCRECFQTECDECVDDGEMGGGR